MTERESTHQRSGHAIYEELARTPEFRDLRSRYRRFAIPASIAFLIWYFLYVLMSIFAEDFMALQVAGNVNVALVFGLLQFVSTFGIAWLYAKHMNRHVDPLARHLDDQYNKEVGR